MTTLPRRTCPHCGRPVAVSPAGAYWTHGWPHCRGSQRHASYNPAAYWPTWHNGRRVVTIPGPDTWTPKENAA